MCLLENIELEKPLSFGSLLVRGTSLFMWMILQFSFAKEKLDQRTSNPRDSALSKMLVVL